MELSKFWNRVKRGNKKECWEWIGTRSENVRDAFKKGRIYRAKGDDHLFRRKPWLAPRGTRNGRALLTDDQVRYIRRKVTRGAIQAELARNFEVSESCIRNIVKQRNWRHIA